MKKRSVVLFSLLAMLLLVVTGCGTPKVEVGMNELTLKQLEKKLDNHETFLLLTFVADEQDVKDSKLIEAFDDSLNRAGLTGFYANLKGEDEKKLLEWGKEHTYSNYDEDWNPVKDGLVLIHDGKKIVTGKMVPKEDIRGIANNEEGYSEDFFGRYWKGKIDSGLNEILEFMEFKAIKFNQY